MSTSQRKNQSAVLSRQSFSRAQLGQSFAEHDLIRDNFKLFVETPAIRAAQEFGGPKAFFIGRRGTGKTAITYYLKNRYPKNTLLLIPKLLSSADAFVSFSGDKRTKQKPFNTLVSAFLRAILDEVVLEWKKQGLFAFRTAGASEITRERNTIENYEFDLRLLYLIDEGFSLLSSQNTKEWLKYRNRPAKIAEEITSEYANQTRMRQVVLIDRLDDEWDESDKAVVLVMALMHACNEIRALTPAVRPMMFLRENVFDRVRGLDGEFSRLETSLVSLDWTRELLRELVERRLNEGLISKFALDGSTWKVFFEGDQMDSEDRVFKYCQYRPRDVLLYASTALGIAQSHQSNQIKIRDLEEAQKSFSENRLKELADEYADNYPRLGVILNRFYGLGTEYTIGSIEDFIKKLLTDEEVKADCGTWIYNFTAPEAFILLLYNLGFWGVKQSENKIRFKSSEAENPSALVLKDDSVVTVHPSYMDGLQLQRRMITSLGEEVALRTSGIISDVPESFSTMTYRTKLQELSEELATMPVGRMSAAAFEDLMGSVIRLCFFRSLQNLESKARAVDGTIIRDWVVSNRAPSGFWAIVREKYGATQVIWECKNYADLKADDFHQAGYYMNEQSGRFLIMTCRAQEPFSQQIVNHVKRVFQQTKGLVLILREPDIRTFLRQALNGKRSEQHLQDVFDNTERLIS